MRFFLELLQRSYVVPIAPKTSLRGSCSSVCGVTRPSGRHVNIRYATAPRDMARLNQTCVSGSSTARSIVQLRLSQARGSRCFAATNTTVTCSLWFYFDYTCLLSLELFSSPSPSVASPKTAVPPQVGGPIPVPFHWIIQAHDFGGDKGGK